MTAFTDREAELLATRPHLARMNSPAGRAMAHRVAYGTATDDEVLRYAIDELHEALDVLPPNSVTTVNGLPRSTYNGRTLDVPHAGCCVMRALFSLVARRNRNEEAALEAAIAESRARFDPTRDVTCCVRGEQWSRRMQGARGDDHPGRCSK